MNLFLDSIYLDADGVYLGCGVHSNEEVYVIKDGADVEYEAGESFVLSDEDLWYNKEDGYSITTKTERDITFSTIEEHNEIGEVIERHYIYLSGAKTPLHNRKVLKGVEIQVVTGDILSTKDVQYLVRSYFRHNRMRLEVL